MITDNNLQHPAPCLSLTPALPKINKQIKTQLASYLQGWGENINLGSKLSKATYVYNSVIKNKTKCFIPRQTCSNTQEQNKHKLHKCSGEKVFNNWIEISKR